MFMATAVYGTPQAYTQVKTYVLEALHACTDLGARSAACILQGAGRDGGGVATGKFQSNNHNTRRRIYRR
jgi:hypothetical protein